MVFMIIGPRQTTGVLSSTRKPMLITFTPYFSRGMRVFSPSTFGRSPCRPIISGTLGP
jgi:hypothetical protein